MDGSFFFFFFLEFISIFLPPAQTQLVEAMFHIEFDKEQFMGALRQLSLASLNMQQRETIIGLFLSFKRSSAGQLEDVSQEMSRIIARSMIIVLVLFHYYYHSHPPRRTR